MAAKKANGVAADAQAVLDKATAQVEQTAKQVAKRVRPLLKPQPVAFRGPYKKPLLPLVAYQPFKAIFVLVYVLLKSVAFPWYIIYYALNRPHPSWTLSQAIRNEIVRSFLWASATVYARTPQNLVAGAEKDRFTVIEPSKKDIYKGVLLENPLIKPVRTGGTWYPTAPKKGDVSMVVLHFHGGAFAIQDTRPAENNFMAGVFNKSIARRAFLVSYRLSTNPGCSFPAAIQDCVTAYQYLLDEGIPPENIIISGDSAGGNLCLALLRYIKDHPGTLPDPVACLLWSPWIDPAGARDVSRTLQSEHLWTDYIPTNFGPWGAHAYIPDSTGLPKDVVLSTAHSGYITPKDEPFLTKTPMWWQAGSCEILWDDIMVTLAQFEDVPGNVIEYHESPHCTHDVILVGHIVDRKNDAYVAGKSAGDFVQRHRDARLASMQHEKGQTSQSSRL